MAHRNRVSISGDALSGDNANSLFKNVLILISGVGLSRLIMIISMPIIGRLYSPENFGVLSVMNSSIALLTPVATLNYASGFPLFKTDRMALNSVALCMLISALVICVLFLLYICFGEFVFNMVGRPDLLQLYYFFLFGLLASSLDNIYTMWAIRRKNFGKIAKSSVLNGSTGVVSKACLGYAGILNTGLLWGQMMQMVVVPLYLSRIYWAQMKANIGYVTWRRMKLVLKSHSAFLKFRMFSKVLTLLNAQMPIYVFSIYLSIEQAGQLGMAFLALAMPARMLGKSVGKVYYAEVALMGRSQGRQIFNLSKSVFTKLFALGFIPFVCVYFYGPEIFSLGLSIKWGEAGVYAGIMSIYFLTRFIVNPLSNVLVVFELQKAEFVICLLSILCGIGLFLFAILNQYNAVEMLTLYSSVMIVINIAYIMFIYMYLKSKSLRDG